MNSHYTLRHPQAVAWAIVLTGFVLFCVISTAGTAFARWFLVDSQIDVATRLTVSRGRIDMTLPDGSPSTVTTQNFLDGIIELQVDDSSQGYLTFEDNYSRQVIATLFLLQNSGITLEQRWRPRFEWSGSAYSVRLTRAIGRFVLDIPSDVSRPIFIDIQSGAGNAQFSEPGTYSLMLNDESITVNVERGSAVLRLPSDEALRIEPGSIGSIRRDEVGRLTMKARPSPFLVLNADFGSPDDISTNPALPVGWVCYSRANKQNEPQGNYARIAYDQRAALTMYRRGQGLDHAETSCEYTFDDDNPLTPLDYDVTGLASLSIRLRLKVQAQDVWTCGVQGSECPVMIALEYLGEGNTPDQPQVWRHGFYTLRPANDDNPLTCDTCQQNHEKVNVNTWYIYESDDLLKLYSGNRKPLTILRLKVYSSGHAYEATVADLAVIATRRH